VIAPLRGARWWSAARGAAFAGLLALLALAIVDHDAALRLVWGIIVPLLPITLLISPALWRGICPLSTLNEAGNRLGGTTPLSPRDERRFAIVGLVLFAVLVPARHLVFDQDAVILTGTILGVGVLAVVLGARYQQRSAFCNGLCPILPVERLYGQSPLVAIGRGRCATCAVCTPRGCLDLAGDKALAQTLGHARRDQRWLATPLGFFAAALPGFIVGFNQLSDAPVPSFAQAYVVPLGAALGSVAATAILVALLRPAARGAIVALSASAITLHYWYAGPTLARSFGLAGGASVAFRMVAFSVIAVWTVRALRRPGWAAGSGTLVR
jgi:hypothetical protein